MTDNHIGEWLKRVRNTWGLTQEEFAQQIGTSYRNYQGIEASGRPRGLAAGTRKAVAEGLGVSSATIKAAERGEDPNFPTEPPETMTLAEMARLVRHLEDQVTVLMGQVADSRRGR